MAATTTELNPATLPGGNKIAGDTLTTVNGAAAPSGAVAHYAKLAHGAAGELKDTTAAQPLPTADQALPALIGALDAAAAASDTANAPTNGVLKRIAQNITSTITALGTKVTAVAALGAGGAGVIGWLSQVWDVLQSRLPTLSSGRVPVDGSGVTQPVSIAATVVTSDAATTALNDKFGTLGRKAAAGAAPAVLSDEDLAVLTATRDRLPTALLNGRLATDPLGKPGTPRTLAFTGTSATIALSAGATRFSMAALDAAAYYRVYTGADQIATTDDHLIMAGERLDWDCDANTKIAALRLSTTNGSIRISEII